MRPINANRLVLHAELRDRFGAPINPPGSPARRERAQLGMNSCAELKRSFFQSSLIVAGN